MASVDRRQGNRRTYAFIAAGLVAALGLLAAYWYFYGSHFQSDPEAMAALREAKLPEQSGRTGQVGDWPQWRGPDRDGVSAESGLLTQWPAKGPEVLWRKKVGAGHSCLAVAGGRVYTMMRRGADEVVVCWKADTGEEVWQKSYPGKYDVRKFTQGYGDGPRSTPTVDGNSVYTVGATGLMHCWDAATGAKKWAVDLIDQFRAPVPQYGVAFSPLVVGDLIITNPGGPDGNSFAALDKRTGAVVWHSGNDPAAYSSPVLFAAEGLPPQVLFFTARGLAGVAPRTGEVLWEYPWKTDYDCNIATPVVVGRYVFISSDYGKGCALLEVRNGEGGKPGVRSVYEGDQMCNHYATSVYWKGHFYGFNNSLLSCLDFRTGQVVWKQRGFQKGSLVLADGHLIVLGERGKLAVAEASPKDFQPTATFQVTKNKCWTMPVFAEGKLFVRDEAQVICLKMK